MVISAMVTCELVYIVSGLTRYFIFTESTIIGVTEFRFLWLNSGFDCSSRCDYYPGIDVGLFNNFLCDPCELFIDKWDLYGVIVCVFFLFRPGWFNAL